jgi:CRP-like cAMP-binding protein
LSQEEVATGQGGTEEIISELLPYDIVGDVAVVCNVPQPYSVRVSELCSVLRIDRQSLTSILQIYSRDNRQILSNLLKVTCQQQNKIMFLAVQG